jgi:hypothetical protein
MSGYEGWTDFPCGDIKLEYRIGFGAFRRYSRRNDHEGNNGQDS